MKNAIKDKTGTMVWAPVDYGWAAQFRAVKSIGYSNGVSLETHWRGEAVQRLRRVRVGRE